MKVPDFKRLGIPARDGGGDGIARFLGADHREISRAQVGKIAVQVDEPPVGRGVEAAHLFTEVRGLACVQ